MHSRFQYPVGHSGVRTQRLAPASMGMLASFNTLSGIRGFGQRTNQRLKRSRRGSFNTLSGIRGFGRSVKLQYGTTITMFQYPVGHSGVRTTWNTALRAMRRFWVSIPCRAFGGSDMENAMVQKLELDRFQYPVGHSGVRTRVAHAGPQDFGAVSIPCRAFGGSDAGESCRRGRAPVFQYPVGHSGVRTNRYQVVLLAEGGASFNTLSGIRGFGLGRT